MDAIQSVFKDPPLRVSARRMGVRRVHGRRIRLSKVTKITDAFKAAHPTFNGEIGSWEHFTSHNHEGMFRDKCTLMRTSVSGILEKVIRDGEMFEAASLRLIKTL